MENLSLQLRPQKGEVAYTTDPAMSGTLGKDGDKGEAKRSECYFNAFVITLKTCYVLQVSEGFS